MFCHNCCKEIPDDSIICDGCGKKLKTTEIQQNSGTSYRQFLQIPVSQQNNTYTRNHVKSYNTKHKTLKRIGIILAVILASFLLIISALFFLMQYTNFKLLNFDIKSVNIFAAKQEKSITMGSYEGRTYTNNYFDISFTVPDGWTIASKEEMASFFKTNVDYNNLENEKNIYLTYATKQSLENSVASFVYGTEKMPFLFAPSIEDYIKSIMKKINQDGSYTFSDTVKQTIDGVEFTVLKAKTQSISQDTYFAIRNNYYMFFIITYVTNDDKATLENIISSVKFD